MKDKIGTSKDLEKSVTKRQVRKMAEADYAQMPDKPPRLIDPSDELDKIEKQLGSYRDFIRKNRDSISSDHKDVSAGISKEIQELAKRKAKLQKDSGSK
jgi:hypothetical protein